MSFGRSNKPRAPLNAAGLFEYGVRSLGRAMRTEADLRRLMHQRVEPGEAGKAIIDAVVLKLKERGYLNDAAFAETYVRLRHDNEKLGQRNVRQKLQQKGVSGPIINDTLEARYGGTDEEALARAHLDRKRIHKPVNEKETSRVMRRLIAAGFSTGVIYRILRNWDVPDETLAALESVSDDTETDHD